METTTFNRRIAMAFGRRAGSYDQNASIQGKLIELVADEICDCTKPGDILLDLGCGTGLLESALKARQSKHTVVGMDIAYLPLLKTRQQNNTLQKVQADMLMIPLNSQSVNSVVIASSLQWVSDPAEVLRQIARVLIPDGHCIFSLFVNGSFEQLYAQRSSFGLSQPITLLNEQAITEMFTTEGFIIRSSSILHHIEYFPDARTLLKSLSLVGATAVKGRRMTRRELTSFCESYEQKFRTEKGIPLTYRAIYGWATLVKGE